MYWQGQRLIMMEKKSSGTKEVKSKLKKLQEHTNFRIRDTWPLKQGKIPSNSGKGGKDINHSNIYYCYQLAYRVTGKAIDTYLRIFFSLNTTSDSADSENCSMCHGETLLIQSHQHGQTNLHRGVCCLALDHSELLVFGSGCGVGQVRKQHLCFHLVMDSKTMHLKSLPW